jgi:hypothetical protein
METKVGAIPKEKVLSATRYILMIGFLMLAPIIPGHLQPVTGPIVNAILFLSTYFFILRDCYLLALVPSLIGAISGLLPAPLIPMIPYIIVSNFILIFVFAKFKNQNYWFAVMASSIAKFLFLFATSTFFMNLFFKKELPLKIAQMMSWPQLATAVIGGVIAYLILLFLNRSKK